MSHRLDKHQLEEALDKLFEHMEKTKGIRIADETKKDIKKELSAELSDKFTHDEIKDPNLQKKLMSAITSFVMGKRKEFDNMVTSLKDEDKRCEHDPVLEKKLAVEMLLLAAATKLLDPNNENQNKLTPKLFAEKTKENQDPKKANKEEMNLAAQQLEATLRNLNGGDNPSVNGEIQFPILGPVFGNLYAYTNQTTPDPNSLSEMVESITYNAGKTDYLGLENITKQDELSAGIEPPGAELEVSHSPKLTHK
jgi:hypothetical protein